MKDIKKDYAGYCIYYVDGSIELLKVNFNRMKLLTKKEYYAELDKWKQLRKDYVAAQKRLLRKNKK